jgi:hypothetical protein
MVESAHQPGVRRDGHGHRDDGHDPERQRVIAAAEPDERHRDAPERESHKAEQRGRRARHETLAARGRGVGAPSAQLL